MHDDRPAQHEAQREELLDLARFLGEENRGLAILGEGNVSASCGDGTFWIKASGSSLATLSRDEVSRVNLARVLAALERPGLDEREVAEVLTDPATTSEGGRPSVETFLHAVCLRHGARAVAHTHPVAVNAILCSARGAEPFLRHVFPDAVVVCGRAPAVLPYVDPGLALAVAADAELARFEDHFGTPPKVLLLENHGLVALGASPREARNITLMADKWARILLGSATFGGPAHMSDEDVVHIDARLDEHYRRSRL